MKKSAVHFLVSGSIVLFPYFAFAQAGPGRIMACKVQAEKVLARLDQNLIQYPSKHPFRASGSFLLGVGKFGAAVCETTVKEVFHLFEDVGEDLAHMSPPPNPKSQCFRLMKDNIQQEGFSTGMTKTFYQFTLAPYAQEELAKNFQQLFLAVLSDNPEDVPEKLAFSGSVLVLKGASLYPLAKTAAGLTLSVKNGLVETWTWGIEPAINNTANAWGNWTNPPPLLAGTGEMTAAMPIEAAGSCVPVNAAPPQLFALLAPVWMEEISSSASSSEFALPEEILNAPPGRYVKITYAENGKTHIAYVKITEKTASGNTFEPITGVDASVISPNQIRKIELLPESPCALPEEIMGALKSEVEALHIEIGMLSIGAGIKRLADLGVRFADETKPTSYAITIQNIEGSISEVTISKIELPEVQSYALKSGAIDLQIDSAIQALQQRIKRLNLYGNVLPKETQQILLDAAADFLRMVTTLKEL